MTASILSATNHATAALQEQVRMKEFPTVTLHRMCYGYMTNDWVMVIASFFTLTMTTVSLVVQGLRG